MSEYMPDTFTLYFIQQFFWGLMVLLSFIGWGRMAHACLYWPNEQTITQPIKAHVDWGLMAGWGMAISLIIGGVLNSFALVSRDLLILYVVMGAIVGAITLYANRIKLPALSPFYWVVFTALGVALLFIYASSIQLRLESCADDDIAYIPFIKRMLQTGSLLDPFSLRRIAGFGGQTFLQALIGSVGNENAVNMMDRGVAILIFFGLVLGHFRTPEKTAATPYNLSPVKGLILILMVALLPLPFLNSASHATGLVILLTLFRTIERTENPATDKPQAPNFQMLWMIGAIIAAAGSLRPHFLMFAALGVVLFWFVCWWQNKRHTLNYVRTLLHVGVASLAFLTPWMMTLYYSSNTMLYPLFRGYHRASYEIYSAGKSPLELLQFIGHIMSEPRMVIFWLPLVMLGVYKHSRAALALSLATLITAFTVTAVFSFSNIDNLHRYIAPIGNAVIIGTVIVFIRRSETNPNLARKLILSRFTGTAILALSALILAPAVVIKNYRVIEHYWDRPMLASSTSDIYTAMQASIPPGAGFMTMVFHPFAWDYQRNHVANIDTPGAVSPDPGMPFFEGPQALKEYLLKLDLPYLAIGDFDEPGMCLYHRRLWQYHRDIGFPIWQKAATFYLDFMDNADALARNNPVIFQQQGYRVIQLQ